MKSTEWDARAYAFIVDLSNDDLAELKTAVIAAMPGIKPAGAEVYEKMNWRTKPRLAELVYKFAQGIQGEKVERFLGIPAVRPAIAAPTTIEEFEEGM